MFGGLQESKKKNKKTKRGFPNGASGNNLPADGKDVRDVGSIPGSGRIHGGGHGSPRQISCLENPMDRGVW